MLVLLKRKTKKKKHKEVGETSESEIAKEPVLENPNNISISDAETENDNELVNDIDKDHEPNKEGSDVEPEKSPKNRKYNKEEHVANTHGSE